ncbi:urease accessory protein UreH domain-containing protein [Kineococcus arenarius]|uniref:urease accessory protein UreH domain-containing protein n=1 Tax=Kineococcus sp. SYSU DK007 TaxID=3383128 RepID=UPI003D7C43DC
MLSSITPLGERGRASRWPVTVAAYLTGSAAGGLALGTLLGLLGALLPLEQRAAAAVATALLAVFAAASVAVEMGRLPQLPTWHRQVDEDWLHRYRGWVYGVGYGAQLGVGVVTIVTSPVLYAALALAVLGGEPLAGAAVGLVFGAVRALPVVALRGVTTPQRLARAHRGLERRAPAARTAAAATSAVVSLAAAAQVAALVTG